MIRSKSETSSVVLAIFAVSSLVLYIVTNSIPFAVIAIFIMILSTEQALLGAIEKTKEGE